MKERLFFLLKVILAYVGVFAIGKIAFMAAHWTSDDDASLADALAAIWNGLSLDVTIALYLLSVPFLVVTVSVFWKRWQWLAWLLKGYFAIMALPVVLAIVADNVLYRYWGIKLDASVLQFLDTTGAAFTSISWWAIILLIIVIALGTWGIAYLLIRMTPRNLPILSAKKQLLMSVLMVLLLPLIIIGIRGGVGESTSNVGQVYFSQKQFFNHAAVNPVFSFLSSFSSTHQLPDHHFYDSETCHQLTDHLFFTTSRGDSTLLRIKQPHIVMIIMEGCGGTFTMLNGRPDVTPNLTRLAAEGVFFSNCYANSWRTDRGNVSILSGYPAFPNSSVMKMAQKCDKLPSIARTLSHEGYRSRYIYGGDINFTNTKGYLMGTGFAEALGDKDFSLSEQRSSSWGVCDEKVFEHTVQLMKKDRQQYRKTMNVVMTLSSHEPWDVPMEKVFDDEILNAFHYLDKSIGSFVEQLKANDLWKETLLMILPDHGTRYQEYGYGSAVTCHIPMIWTGGAVAAPKDVKVLCNQSDLAATLLGQMGIPHDDFPFSRDVLSRDYRHPFASYSFTNHIALIDSTHQFHLYDLQDKRTADDTYYRLAKALLQMACEDLRNR